MKLYKWFYNIFKIISTYSILVYLTNLIILDADWVIIISILILPLILLWFCYGYDMYECKSTYNNLYDRVIKFIFAYKPENYKYKVDEITYNNGRVEYYPRIKTSLIEPYYYLEKSDLNGTFYFNESKNDTSSYNTQENAAYIIKQHKEYIQTITQMNKDKKDNITIKSRKSLKLNFKN